MAQNPHAARLARLLKRQHGLLTFAQAGAYGIPASTLGHRLASGRWQRVLPRVYATFALDLTEEQRVWAAVLYVGDGAAITGLAALRRHRIKRLPQGPSTIHVTCPPGRQSSSRDFVTVQRTIRSSPTVLSDHVCTMSVARATIDAAARIATYDATLDLLTAVIHSHKASLPQVQTEAAIAPNAGTRWLRAAIREAGLGSRSVAEARARRLFAAARFPPPLVNQAIVVNGQTFVPDFRWGKVIVEVDSKEFHLLHPGSWEATIQRRMVLSAAGYHVIPVSPAQLRDSPQLVLAVVADALGLAA